MAPQPSKKGQPCLATPLTRKLVQLVSLSTDEVTVLRNLQSIEGQRLIEKYVEALGRLRDFERTYLSRFQLNDLFAKT